MYGKPPQKRDPTVPFLIMMRENLTSMPCEWKISIVFGWVCVYVCIGLVYRINKIIPLPFVSQIKYDFFFYEVTFIYCLWLSWCVCVYQHLNSFVSPIWPQLKHLCVMYMLLKILYCFCNNGKAMGSTQCACGQQMIQIENIGMFGQYISTKMWMQ